MELALMYYAKDHVKLTSAYGKCVSNIVPRLSKKYPISIYYTVPLTYYHDTWNNIKMYTGIEDHMKGEDNLLYVYDDWKSINKDKTPLLFVQMDAWIYNELYNWSEQGLINLVNYIPVDFYPIPQYIINKLKKSYKVVAMCKWARDELRKAGLNNVSETYLYHGIDPNIYKPFASTKQETKKKYIDARASLGADENTFLITIIGANQIRKMWQQSIEGIKIFIENNPNIKARIYIHSQPNVKDGFNLPAMVESYGLSNITRMSEFHHYFHGLYSEEVMATIYNCSDVLINCSPEGFGLPTIEAMACGTPVIGLDFGATKEIMELITPELLVKVRSWFMFGTLINKPIPCPEDIARKIELVINHNREHYHKRLSEYIHNNFTWDKIVNEGFFPLLEEVGNDIERRCIEQPKHKENKEIRVIE